ncbi:MAG: amino acid ABC transporter permease [Anaerolineae bacterium]|nr:amino acid ABC transporter permease [Anaerolineae bacterium]
MTTMKPKNDELDVIYQESRQRVTGPFARAYTAPWWLVIMVGLWLWVVYQMANDAAYADAFNQIKDGIPLTIWLAVASYVLALIIGLLTGIMRSYPPEPPETKLPPLKQAQRVFYVLFYNVVSVYIEFMRGIPPLVFLLIAGFIVVPAIRGPIEQAINSTLIPLLRIIDPEITDVVWRGRDPATAIAGLSLIYGAFLSEIFRAGIQAIPKGQVEAAKSLGMTNLQTMRLVVIPQAIRNVLPPLGNDFIAMIKDTSLVTILGTSEITQISRRWSGSQFTYLETYAVLSMIYLTMTVTGSLLVQFMERYLRRFARR